MIKRSLKLCYIGVFFKHSLRHSFTLIELSIALSVIGILSAVGISAYKASNPELKKDLKKIKAIEDKLQEFFNVNGRLPFPANPAENISNTNYLTEAIYKDAYNASKERFKSSATSSMADGGTTYNACATKSTHCLPGDFVVWGVIPTRTLGLPDDYAYDSQGHNFEYITHSAVAYKNDDPFDNGNKSNYTTNNNGRYDVSFSNGTTIPLEKLSIYNNKTNKQIQTTANNTAYVIMSKGKTNKCFFNTRTSTAVNSTKPTGNLLKNCVSNYSNNSTTERTIYQGYSKDFDNIVKYKTLNDLIYAKANAEEAKNEMTQGRIISYQPRDDTALQTNSKNIISAINELKSELEALKTENTTLKAKLNNIQSTNSTSKMFLMGATSQTSQPTTYSQSQVYMENGTLYLTKTTDLSGTANNKPALIVGGSDTQAHIEIDANEIHAKKNGTNVADMWINTEGGSTHISPNGHIYMAENEAKNVYVGKLGGSSKIYLNGNEFKPGTTLTKAQICEMMYPVGSIYINYSKTDNPKDLLGCGTWELVPRDYYIRSADADGATNFRDLYSIALGTLLNDVALPNIFGYFGPVDDGTSIAIGAFETGLEIQYDATSKSSGSGHYITFNASKNSSAYVNTAKNLGNTLVEISYKSTIDLCYSWCANMTLSLDYYTYDIYYDISDQKCSCTIYQYKNNIRKFTYGYVQPASFNVLIWKRTA